MSTICPVCNNQLPDEASACPVCGFKLIGSTQEFSPLVFDEENASLPTKAREIPERASLRVIRGPQIETVFTLSDQPLVIGRSPHCDIFLNDMTVSREHARILPLEGGYCIEDSNSYNGVWVNNKSVDSQMLTDADIIQVGTFCLIYQVTA